jgi:hypothetical protein
MYKARRKDLGEVQELGWEDKLLKFPNQRLGTGIIGGN